MYKKNGHRRRHRATKAERKQYQDEVLMEYIKTLRHKKNLIGSIQDPVEDYHYTGDPAAPNTISLLALVEDFKNVTGLMITNLAMAKALRREYAISDGDSQLVQFEFQYNRFAKKVINLTFYPVSCIRICPD